MIKMMGCFSTSASRVEKQRSASAPRTGPLRSVIASKDSLTLLANKPVELPDPGSIVSGRSTSWSFENEHRNAPVTRLSRFGDEVPGSRKSRTQILKGVEDGRTAFSGPLVGKTGSRLVPGYESSCEGARSNSCGLRTLRRTTSFGGRPQPLPLPVAEETLAPATAKDRAKQGTTLAGTQEVCLPLPAPEDAGRRSRRVRSFTLEDGAGVRSGRRGRVAPVGGLPLPPPSLGGKFTAYEFADAVAGAATPRGAFGDVHRARVEDLSRESHANSGLAVFRFPENAAYVR